MNPYEGIQNFRLRRGGIDCDAEGLRVGDVPLLARDAQGNWAMRGECEVNRALTRTYGFPVDVSARRRGVTSIAAALTKGEIARAQIGALFLQLPDPPDRATLAKEGLGAQKLARDLRACGLLKADPGWDDEHPRTGEAPNPGWFAPKPKPEESGVSPPVDNGPSTAFVAPTFAARAWLGSELSATALDALATLASRYSTPAILFGAIFAPSGNALVDQGPIPSRADMSYRWARDEAQVTFDLLVDGQWRTFAIGALKPGDIFVDAEGDIVARMVRGPAGKTALVTTADALDRAAADFRARNGLPAAAPSSGDHEPKLCPDPTPEAQTSKSENSIAYQEYVTGLPYGLAINVGGVNFDGCDEKTGNLLEAKAFIDFLFDPNNNLYGWVNPDKKLQIQMLDQSDAALAAGRSVVWHAQTLKGFAALSKIAAELDRPNLSVVYDPN